MPPKRFFRKTKPANDATEKRSIVVKWLIIVESPSKCKKIEEYLGSEYQCIASKGHIRTIDGLKSIDTKRDFSPTFSIIDEKVSHIETMRSIIADFPKENILIATDDDREGEAIGWHICELFELPIETTKRILFHEITRDAIQLAVANPTTLNMPLVYAQHSRQVLDMIVGYTVSPLLWKHIYNDKTNGLSAGRCQTPALRFVYDHFLHNKHAKMETHYNTTGYFFERNIRFQLHQTHKTETEVVAFLEESRTFNHILSITPIIETYKQPPKPFTTSRLLQSASSILRISPKNTMGLCQQLYQMGLITYMRTDSGKYSPVFLKQVETYILREWVDVRYVGDLASLENTDVGNPHEAIRVTNIHMAFITDENKSLVSMYRFLWKNTVESCMSIAKYNTRHVRLTAPGANHYEHTLEIPVFQGWKRACSTNEDTAQQQCGMVMYFESFVNKPVIIQCIESVVSVSEMGKRHYTEASLIQTLEEASIGRPSTYASIIETIQERGYVKKMDIKGQVVKCSEYKLVPRTTLEKTEKERSFGQEKDKLVIQPTGIIVLEFLLQHFEDVFSYDYTKMMEGRLDQIAESNTITAMTTWRELCRECYHQIKSLKKPLSKLIRETYTLEKDTELVFHTNGSSIKRTLEDGTMEYKTVKKDVEIDLGKLKRGEYSSHDLIEIPDEHLGVFEEENVLLKSGRYGAYLVCGDMKVSLKTVSKPLDAISLSDVMPLLILKKRGIEIAELEADSLDISAIPDTYQRVVVPETTTTLRVLTKEMSVRTGKYGPYVYYQKSGVKKPTFFNIKKYKDDCWTCSKDALVSWLCDTYHLPKPN